ncbi:MAG: hypothetical protein GF411_15805 [Candidatus Lokiarchaeota archaeon]|nr:hypothetical protein [Candidatus Lokiarchaeota archaeon]
MRKGVSWPLACWGCGTDRDLRGTELYLKRREKKSEIEYKRIDSEETDTRKPAIFAPAIICLCENCKEYADQEQKRMTSLYRNTLFAGIILTILPIIIAFFLNINQIMTIDLEGVIALFSSGLVFLWIPILMFKDYRDYSLASPHHSFYQFQLGDGELASKYLYFRSKSFFEKFKGLNSHIRFVYRKPGIYVQPQESTKLDSLLNKIGNLTFCCFYLLPIILAIAIGFSEPNWGIAVVFILAIPPIIVYFGSKYYVYKMQTRYISKCKETYPGLESDIAISFLG